MTISEKAAYIKGLLDGADFDFTTKEGKVIGAIVDLLSDICETIDEIEENALNIGDELDALSDDLAEVEEVVFGEDDDECDCDDCDCDCDDCDCDCEDDEDFMISVDCPSCNEEIVIDESILEAGKLQCPNCGEKLELEFDDEDEEEEE